MDSKTRKIKPLTREEMKALLTFIEASKVLNNRSLHITTNMLKNEWSRIADQFNANVTSCRRTPQQLRLKWENLKKHSLKRSTAIQMNNFETGGGGLDYIPPDDILDHVSSLLRCTVDGFVVEFGGDAELTFSAPQASGFKRKRTIDEGQAARNLAIAEYNVTKKKLLEAKLENEKLKLVNKELKESFKRKRTIDEGQAARNLAIAEYYVTKKKLLEAKLENEKLKLVNKELKKRV